jgi:hypothetical protein
LLCALAWAACGWPAVAQAPARAPQIQSLIECRKIDPPDQRLACYDRGVDAMAKAEAAGDLVALDREQRGALRRQSFGLDLPNLDALDPGRKAEQDNRITAKIVAASQDARGRWTVQLEGGAVWAQMDDAIIYPEPHAGSTAVIRRGTLSSFFMDIDGKPGFRAVRRS